MLALIRDQFLVHLPRNALMYDLLSRASVLLRDGLIEDARGGNVARRLILQVHVATHGQARRRLFLAI